MTLRLAFSEMQMSLSNLTLWAAGLFMKSLRFPFSKYSKTSRNGVSDTQMA